MNADAARRTRTLLPSLLIAAAFTAGCSKTPSSPTESDSGYLGTWSGSITSDVIGAGNATIVLDGGIKSSTNVHVTGTWTFTFAEGQFDAGGTVSGGPLPDGTPLVLLFSTAPVPCPGELNGTAQKGRTATLTVSANRMQGSYIANGCPGGVMDLTRQ